MAKKSTIQFLILVCFVSLIGKLSGQSSFAAQASKGGDWTITEPFSNKVFVENNGQYNTVKLAAPGLVKYAFSNFGEHIYFTGTGIYYHTEVKEPKYNDPQYLHEIREAAEEEFREHGEVKEEKLSHFFKDLSSLVKVEFENANVVEPVALEPTQDYYTYSLVQGRHYQLVQASAFKKLLYKNIYNGIDLEYTFAGEGKKGIKYTFIVHAGADPKQISLKYSGHKSLETDESGNLHIKITSGEIIDHAPHSFLAGTTQIVTSAFSIDNSHVKIGVGAYDPTKTLIIDPWVVNPGFTTSNKGYGIRVDYAGNCYVYGGGAAGFGTSSAYQVKKYSAAGALQWTYTTPTLSMGFYGDITTDQAGNSFIGAGFGFNGGEMDLKLKI